MQPQKPQTIGDVELVRQGETLIVRRTRKIVTNIVLLGVLMVFGTVYVAAAVQTGRWASAVIFGAVTLFNGVVFSSLLAAARNPLILDGAKRQVRWAQQEIDFDQIVRVEQGGGNGTLPVTFTLTNGTPARVAPLVTTFRKPEEAAAFAKAMGEFVGAPVRKIDESK